MMRKIVPFGSVVPTLRFPASAAPSLLAGKPSVVQMLTAVAPGRPEAMCFATSSIFTIALPLASCPVITRRTCTAMCLTPCRQMPGAEPSIRERLPRAGHPLRLLGPLTLRRLHVLQLDRHLGDLAGESEWRFVGFGHRRSLVGADIGPLVGREEAALGSL